MTKLHIDFETRGSIELPDVGVDIYSRHFDTDMWCMAFAFDDKDVDLWANPYTDPALVNDPPVDVVQHVRNGGVVFAHNASFELAIWNNIMVPRYGWPELKPEQMRCTMAMAYAMGLPGSLEKAAAAVGITQQKDLSGYRLMMQMAKPRNITPPPMEYGVNVIEWWDQPDKLQRLYEYCKQDVRVERELDKRLLQLSESEQALWVLDQKINQRGVYVDKRAIEAAIDLVEREQSRLAHDIREATGGTVSAPSEVSRLTKWICSRGVDTSGLAKADVVDLLSQDTLPGDVRSALLIRQEAAKTSTSKLQSMLSAISHDGRIKNILQYHGAATGRWAGRRIQPQNMPRPKLTQDEIEGVLAILAANNPAERKTTAIELLYGPCMSVISDCLRGMITAAPGHELIAADFANIEGRVLAWLANEEWKLQAFRDYDTIVGYDAKNKPIRKGADLYILAYAKSFNIDHKMISKEDPRRQVGKVEELAFGFQGGKGAWRTMERAYPGTPYLSDEAVQDIKNRWRSAHPRINQYWYDLENAALEAVRHPGLTTSAGIKGREVKYRVKGSFLFCRLPSGRVLTYPYPRLDTVMAPWGDPKEAVTYKTVLDSTQRQKAKVVDDPTNKGDWVRVSTYGGKLAENVTQAVARDVLADAMKRLDDLSWSIIMHVHDEIVIEVDEDHPKSGLGYVEELMSRTPDWAAGLPIAVEGWRGRRYRK